MCSPFFKWITVKFNSSRVSANTHTENRRTNKVSWNRLLLFLLHYLGSLIFHFTIFLFRCLCSYTTVAAAISFSHLFYNFNKLRASEACRQTFYTHALHLTSWKHNRCELNAHIHWEKTSYINWNFWEFCFCFSVSASRLLILCKRIFFLLFLLHSFFGKNECVMKVFMWINISFRYNLSRCPYQSL